MQDDSNLTTKVFSGLIWRFLERILAQGVSFVISLMLARLLSPENYGTVALLLVFINLANVLINNGFGEALIQNKEADTIDFSTMFHCGFALSIFLYATMFFCAPLIALFYEDPSLTLIFRILGLQVPLAAIKTIQHAYVSKNMLFKKFFFSTFGGTIFSGVVGIIMAYNGLGVWALVQQYLVNSIIDMTVLFFTVPWRPRMIFSWESAKKHISYGWKLTSAAIINALYDEIRSLVIGKKYSTSDLAYYNKGNQFPSNVIVNINASISSVVFPALCTVGEKLEVVKSMTRRAMIITSYIIFPIVAVLTVAAPSFVEILLTDKWLPCVPFLRIGCIYWMFQPVQTANAQAIKAVGKSDVYLKIEIIKKIIGAVILIVSVPFGVTAIALSSTIFAFISMMINIITVRKIINYGVIDQLLDLLPALILSAVMGLICFSVQTLNLSSLVTLILQVMIGCAVYICGSAIFKLEAFSYIRGIIKKGKVSTK